MDEEVYIVSYKRTVFGSYQGFLRDKDGIELAVLSSQGVIDSIYGCLDKNIHIEQMILGNAISSGLGQCPSVQVAHRLKLSFNDLVAYSVNKVCSSGMKSIMLGYDAIVLGKADVVLCCGFESMSNVPHYFVNKQQSKKSHKTRHLGDISLYDGLMVDGLNESIYNSPYTCTRSMGSIAQDIARKYKIKREDQDKYCILSYERTIQNQNLIKDEILPIKNTDGVVLSYDENLDRFDKEKLLRLKPCFDRNDHTYGLTAGNSSSISDGSASLLLMSGSKLREYEENGINLRPLSKILATSEASTNPLEFALSPSLAIKRLFVNGKHGLNCNDIDFFEINEAFGMVPLLNMHELGNLSLDKVNLWGGALGMGHPLGCSGARISGTLSNLLRHYGRQYGVASICNGGGGGSALLLESC